MDRGKPLKKLVVDCSPRILSAAAATAVAVATAAAIPAALAAHAPTLAALRALYQPPCDPALSHRVRGEGGPPRPTLTSP